MKCHELVTNPLIYLVLGAFFASLLLPTARLQSVRNNLSCPKFSPLPALYKRGIALQCLLPSRYGSEGTSFPSSLLFYISKSRFLNESYPQYRRRRWHMVFFNVLYKTRWHDRRRTILLYSLIFSFLISLALAMHFVFVVHRDSTGVTKGEICQISRWYLLLCHHLLFYMFPDCDHSLSLFPPSKLVPNMGINLLFLSPHLVVYLL